jgi:hypothetical protein
VIAENEIEKRDHIRGAPGVLDRAWSRGPHHDRRFVALAIVAASELPVAVASRNAELTCVTWIVSGIDFARTKTLTADIE